MPFLPKWGVRSFNRHSYHTIDWREEFQSDLVYVGQPRLGQMKGFYVVFRLRAERSGTLQLIFSDGCIVRQNGNIVYESREASRVRCYELPVASGDRLEVAHWHRNGEWIWGAGLVRGGASPGMSPDIFKPYWRGLDRALRNPNGPTLKVFTSATDPLRCAVGIYSMVLNGYRPAGIQIYGDYQWDEPRQHSMRTFLPFAEIVPTKRVDQFLSNLDQRLVPLAHQFWSVMKTCVCLFMPPYEYCHLDDDIFVLDRIDEALNAFVDHDLVYQPDTDCDEEYRAAWRPTRQAPLPTRRLNTGFYLLRNTLNREEQLCRFLSTSPSGSLWQWEQGFVACEFAEASVHELPSQRYFYPVLDGLPGGFLGYDWRTNPCGFVTIHFGGVLPKPQSHDVEAVAHEILGRQSASVG